MSDRQTSNNIVQLPRGSDIRQINNQLVLFGNDTEKVKEHVNPNYHSWIEDCAAFLEEEPAPAYVHSALCSMSLPARKPKDDKAPIERRDGDYSLLVTPKPYMEDGEWKYAGVPYGSPSRLIMAYINTSVLINASPTVHLGNSLAAWMRKLGYKNRSGGPRGNITAIKEQVLRTSRSEFTIAWEGAKETLLKEVQVANQMRLWETDDEAGRRRFVQDIEVSPDYYYSIREHAVPLNEHALAYLKHNVTALDLYTWAANRLHRVKDSMVLPWPLLRQSFGSTAKQTSDFRKTIEKALPQVLVAYPDARMDIAAGGLLIEPSKPPITKTIITVPNFSSGR